MHGVGETAKSMVSSVDIEPRDTERMASETVSAGMDRLAGTERKKDHPTIGEREAWLNRCMENVKQFIRNIDVSAL